MKEAAEIDQIQATAEQERVDCAKQGKPSFLRGRMSKDHYGSTQPSTGSL